MRNSIFVVALTIWPLSAAIAAQYNDGYAAYLSGDYEEAFRIWSSEAENRADASPSSRALALYSIGVMQLHGEGIRREDYVGALMSFERAANLGRYEANRGSYLALDAIGEMYLRGIAVQKDGERAALLFEQSAQDGNDRSSLKLGQLYEEGVAVQQDYAKAAYWYRRAAEHALEDCPLTTSISAPVAFPDGG